MILYLDDKQLARSDLNMICKFLEEHELINMMRAIISLRRNQASIMSLLAIAHACIHMAIVDNSML